MKTIALLSSACAIAAAAGLSYVAFAQLPAAPFPAENPPTEAKRVLGKILFWDEQLSSDGTMACATCHLPFRGGVDGRRVRQAGVDLLLNTPDDVFASPGVVRQAASGDYLRDPVFGLAPQVTDRSSMSMINSAYAPELFWDGRARSAFIDPETGVTAIVAGGALENQAVGPVLSAKEMAHDARTWAQATSRLAGSRPLALATDHTPDVAAALQSNPTYPLLFAAAFGDDQITAQRIAFALATYQRSLVSDQTPWDRFQAGDTAALTAAQVRGSQAFVASRCNDCHTAPQFTDFTYRNIGLRPVAEDRGRQNVTNNINDRGKFKVPSLRNVTLRQTLMHNGMFTNLGQVMGFYARAPGAPQQFLDNRDPIMPQINLPPPAATDIQAFLASLTDPRVANSQFPFDRMTLYSQRQEDRPTSVGGGVIGSGSILPTMVAVTPPAVGNADFKLGLDRALGGATAFLLVSSTEPVNGRLVAEQVFGPFTAQGSGAGQGYATAWLPIPADPTLAGSVKYYQWRVSDPLAAGGQSFSNAVRVTFFCPTGGCPTTCVADVVGIGGTVGADGAVTGDDFIAFINAFSQGNTVADVVKIGGESGKDGLVSGDDFNAFINAFANSCQ